MIREIVKIDEELCDGCGECVPNCHEGALRVIDGKARLISELLCDGLGACLGRCPQNAITIEEREAQDYNEAVVIASMIKSGKATVFAHLKHLQNHNEQEYLNQALNYLKTNQGSLPFTVKEVHELLHGKMEAPTNQHSGTGGCPGSAATSFQPSGIRMQHPATLPSALSQWPVQLHLINPAAGYFQEADLLIAADCVAFAYGSFHQKLLPGKKLVIACPKLDQGKEIYLQKITRLIDEANINTITVAIMEVPCCGGLMNLVQNARRESERHVPLKRVVIGIEGELVKEEWI